MSETTATFAYTEPAAPPGAVIGALEIFDIQHVAVGSAVLRNRQPVTVHLPAPGPYLVRGVLSTGARLRRPFTAGQGSGQISLTPPPWSVPDRISTDGWIAVWQWTGADWMVSPRQNDLVPDPAGTRVALPSMSAAVIVQVADGEHPASCVAVPLGADVVLKPDGSETGYDVSVAAGLEATMLAFLHAGDLPSARIVAEDVLREGPKGGSVF